MLCVASVATADGRVAMTARWVIGPMMVCETDSRTIGESSSPVSYAECESQDEFDDEEERSWTPDGIEDEWARAVACGVESSSSTWS